jgi:hypothetical protein
MEELMAQLTQLSKEHGIFLSLEYLPITEEWYATAFHDEDTLFTEAGDTLPEAANALASRLESWAAKNESTKESEKV